MTGICICPDCSNPVRMYEADGISKGKCICGRTLTQSYAGPMESTHKYYALTHVGGSVDCYRGRADTLLEAERICTTYAHPGQKCRVEYKHKTVSEWVDGERDDLKRKIIKVEFSIHDPTYPEGPTEGASTVITTQDVPTYKAIEYYLLKRDITVTKYTVTDDDGRILEESEATSSSGPSCTEVVE